jgi:hypothetical protein
MSAETYRFYDNCKPIFDDLVVLNKKKWLHWKEFVFNRKWKSIETTRPFSLPCKYLQGSENGRVVTIEVKVATGMIFLNIIFV